MSVSDPQCAASSLRTANQAASKDAFEVLHLLTEKRLAGGHFTVIDATNLQPECRKPLLELARRYHVQTAAVVFNLPPDLCQRYNEQRPGRTVAPTVVSAHHELLPKTLAEAVSALKDDRFFRDAFGAEFVDYYVHIKNAEIERFQAEVSDWEHREYFEMF